MSDPISLIFFLLLLGAVLLLRAGVPNARIHFKGAMGEAEISRILRGLPRNEYHVFNDLVLDTEFGSSQIDHVVVAKAGIFVIETKNYKGWIHGSDRAEYWTQSIYKHKTTFRNPVKQNWSHVLALKEVLAGIGRIQYFPIIVFAGSATLKNVYSKTPVIYSDQLFAEIVGQASDYSIPDTQLNEIIRRIEDPDGRPRPIPSRQNSPLLTTQRRDPTKCPKCKNSLVLRNGRFGQFYGCSSYPRCKYTQNI